jgi:hypothetical protein
MTRFLLALALVAVCAFCVVTNGLPITINPEMTRCVDYNSHVVAPELCTARPQMVHVHGSLNPEPLYRPYYGGFGTGEAGSYAWGGSERPRRLLRLTSKPALSRTPLRPLANALIFCLRGNSRRLSAASNSCEIYLIHGVS